MYHSSQNPRIASRVKRSQEMSEEPEQKPSEKPLFSELLKLPFFQEPDEPLNEQDEATDEGAEGPTPQELLVNYVLNLPAFRELEEDQKSPEE